MDIKLHTPVIHTSICVYITTTHPHLSLLSQLASSIPKLAAQQSLQLLSLSQRLSYTQKILPAYDSTHADFKVSTKGATVDANTLA